jgi:hypothetical protein
MSLAGSGGGGGATHAQFFWRIHFRSSSSKSKRDVVVPCGIFVGLGRGEHIESEWLGSFGDDGELD